MMTTGALHKMIVTHENPVQYQLILNKDSIQVNQWLKKKITITFLDEIFCIQCGRKIKQSFQQGYCFPCMQKINECNNCMIHPEKCLVETGQCDPTQWAHQQCHQPHVVYLANSSGLKVGITREKNVPMRWIDQGAAQALPIFKTANRYQAGLIEVALKNYVADKTNWRVMLRETVAPLDLVSQKKILLSQAEKEIAHIIKKYPDAVTLLNDQKIFQFDYPIIQYPTKVTALSLDKTPTITDILQGIKGQYLLFNSGVLNVRKFGGYVVAIDDASTTSKHPQHLIQK